MYPYSKWIFIICIERIHPSIMYKALLRLSLSAFIARFQSAQHMLELVVLSLEQYPQYKSALFNECFSLFEESLVDPQSSFSLNTVPFLLSLFPYIIPFIDDFVYLILEKLTAPVENVLLSQASLREEPLQGCLVPKLASFVLSLLSHELVVIKFLIGNSLNNKKHFQTYVLILLHVVEKAKEIFSSNSVEPVQTPYVSIFTLFHRLRPKTKQLVALFQAIRPTRAHIFVLSLTVLLGLSNRTDQICEILTYFLLLPDFHSKHRLSFLQLSGCFNTACPLLFKRLLEQIAFNYPFFGKNEVYLSTQNSF